MNSLVFLRELEQVLFLNAMGNASEIVIWLAVVIAVLIGASWVFTSFLFKAPSLDIINNDLSSMQFMADDACLADEYNYFFNPSAEDGTMVLSKKEICITSNGVQLCRETICDFVYAEFDLSKVVLFRITKQGEKIFLEVTK